MAVENENSVVRASDASNDDVFAEYGYNDIPTASIVVQSGDEIIVNNVSDGLTPPPIDDDMDDAEEIQESSEEILGSTVISQVEEMLGDSIDNLVTELLNEQSALQEISVQTEVTHEEPATPESDLAQIPDEYYEKDSVSRFRGAEWYEDVKHITIHIIGVGGIGSMAALAIGRLNPCHIILQDPDIVEAANMSGQFYTLHDTGKNKVDTVKRKLHEFCEIYYITTRTSRFDQYSEFETIPQVVVCGLDNMDARKHCFNAWCRAIRRRPADDRHNFLFIDGRLTINELQIFCIMGSDDEAIAKYKQEYLFDSSEAIHTVCSVKQTTYCSMMIGGLIANLIVNFMINKRSIADLPFKTYYNAIAMTFKTESVYEQ